MNIQLLSITLMIALVFANGCATTNTARTKINMKNSKAAYERCLELRCIHPCIADTGYIDILKSLYDLIKKMALLTSEITIVHFLVRGVPMSERKNYLDW